MLSFLKGHSLLLLLILAAVFTIVWLWLMRERLSAKPYSLVLLAIVHVLYGVFTVKIFAFAEAGFDQSSAGNMSLFGAVFLMPPAYWLGAKLFKRDPRVVFDVFAVCMIFTLLCARCNCLIAGCCQGKLIPGSEARYPTREIEIVFYLVLLEVLIYRLRKKKANGALYPIYMVSYGVLRFVLEFFRESDQLSTLHRAHYWSILSLVLGLLALFILRKKTKKGA